MSRPPRILLSAGEASGDRLGAGLARALRRLRPDVELSGMGGSEMAEAGVRLVQDASEVAVVGVLEVLSRLPQLRAAMARLTSALDAGPDLLVPIDFPDFNLRLAGEAARRGVPVVYFVSPQVWAWRRGRVRGIRRRVARMLVLFPFEVPFYAQAGVPVTFVGHPMAGTPEVGAEVTRALAERLGLSPAARRLILLPGSRPGEVARLLPRMLAAAGELRRTRPDLEVLLPLAQGLDAGEITRQVAASEVPATRVHRGDYPAVLTLGTAGIAASGTATLDAALAGLPVAVVYAVQPLTYLLGRLLVRVDHIALPNLVLGRRLLPELVQGAFTPAAAAGAVAPWLDAPPAREEVRAGLREVRARLGESGALDRAAAAILGELPATN
ncbi:MAG TPA: lipid-A-disaccharide synthase [Candidatus Polarisedimenticolaceae bacterium]|nr:lipid-A-disaccharide synthase [Candidatus Polarisedimenticolaceae bacterium]